MRLKTLSLGALWALSAALGAADADVTAVALSPAAATAPDGLQQQLDALKAELQYIRDNYERSEPVEIVKPVTEYVSPQGEIFTTLPKGGVSPSDGSKLEERVTYRKMKFNRRESVNDKIDSAVSAAIDGHVVVGLELLGRYANKLGAGSTLGADGNTRSANRGSAVAGVDFNLSGKPMRNTLMFVNFDAANGKPSISEAWVSAQSPGRTMSLQVGVVDLTGSFDANKAANDDSAQFVTDDLVNSPLLSTPGSRAGAIARWDNGRYSASLGAQDGVGGTDDLFDNLYWIGELGTRFHLLGDVHLRVWGRQQPRGSRQPDQALGVSYDHRLTTRLTAFGRYGKSAYIESYTPADPANAVVESRTALNTLDWTASGGFELSYPFRRRLHDKLGLAYAKRQQQDRAAEEKAEAYYKATLTPNVALTLFGQGLFSRVVASSDPALMDPSSGGDPKLNDAKANEWTVGIRALASY